MRPRAIRAPLLLHALPSARHPDENMCRSRGVWSVSHMQQSSPLWANMATPPAAAAGVLSFNQAAAQVFECDRCRCARLPSQIQKSIEIRSSVALIAAPLLRQFASHAIELWYGWGRACKHEVGERERRGPLLLLPRPFSTRKLRQRTATTADGGPHTSTSIHASDAILCAFCLGSIDFEIIARAGTPIFADPFLSPCPALLPSNRQASFTESPRGRLPDHPSIQSIHIR